ncbi:MAG TPA: hypothetical protein VFX92_08470, partial [Candidatus Krumholzibacteria bacterium]|nr:hypothetical protein [Candidatus Krumholzibacteria bacterium]
MKKVLLISLAIMMVAGSAMADHIGIYTDQVGTLDACTIVPPQFAPFSLYVVHKLSTASTGSEFMITDPNLTGWSYSGSSVLNGFL